MDAVVNLADFRHEAPCRILSWILGNRLNSVVRDNDAATGPGPYSLLDLLQS